MLADIVEYIISRIEELDWIAVALGVIVETIIIPIPSPLIPMAAGFALLGGMEWPALLIPLTIKIGFVGAVTATMANIPFYILGEKGGTPIIHRMSRWIGVSDEEIRRAVAIVGGGNPIQLIIYRAVPIIPLSLVSLATGALGKGLRSFTIYTFVGCLPRYLILGYLGWLFRDLYVEMAAVLDNAETALVILIILGFTSYIVVKRLLRR